MSAWSMSNDGSAIHEACGLCSPLDCYPVVVINPEDREQVERLAMMYREQTHAELGPYPMSLPAYRMQAALREFANPTRPKPDEPQGLGAVVEDAEGNLWVRYSEVFHGCAWMRQSPKPTYVAYADIRTVRVLSEGVTR